MYSRRKSQFSDIFKHYQIRYKAQMAGQKKAFNIYPESHETKICKFDLNCNINFVYLLIEGRPIDEEGKPT